MPLGNLDSFVIRNFLTLDAFPNTYRVPYDLFHSDCSFNKFEHFDSLLIITCCMFWVVYQAESLNGVINASLASQLPGDDSKSDATPVGGLEAKK